MTSSDGNAQSSPADALKRYKHPFTEDGEWQYYATKDDDPTDRDTPRTLIELRMCALSAAIREKPEWWVKFRDEKVQAKWRQEIKVQEQQQGLHRSLQLTENMINYIMGELEAYAALRDPETGIEFGPYERIWQSDQLIPVSLKAALISAVTPLESVPDSVKDWHPGSDGKVLNLVHPSLYPVVYGRTIACGSQEPLQPHVSDVAAMFKSEHFQWLPSEFYVEEHGTVKLASPYINNVDPEDYKDLTEVIPRVMEKAVPMFERVLSDLAREFDLEPTPDRELWQHFRSEHDRLQAEDRKHYEAEKDKVLDAAWDVYLDTRASEDEKWAEPPYPEMKEVKYFNRFFDEWQDAQAEHRWPDSKPRYDGGLDDVKKTVDLRRTTLQVIVKLANIILTPEKPEYGGGTWHVEGMDNEAIVSTFIYYYDTDNITESTLSFRNAVNEPRYHSQCDYYCMRHLYDMSADDICAQTVGELVTKQDRCIAFPNLYQHLVSPFRLIDPTKPGHRKILVFFLVDPNIRIPSASTVAPQQEPWIRRAVEGTDLWWRLPFELREMIWARLDPMSQEQAKKYREELMKERTLIVKTVDEQRFGRLFNLWVYAWHFREECDI
ncbi:uncharacterized protein C8Q71DRAFT_720034 [Rhodofomes roseus]|uniref:Uncharacterized protein n=1 Tax=Rhodofomes roseus TaxID=34475 RepID=A0ABQ8KTT5_9APHY|nr:uncharacterized protein C8Q71DRAFT_720034 [Rhodofomes roseus]KAH9842495.1 hypothetical protein C8Q71DRAFT_720034 [Rhodofomes roseus]